MSFLIRLERYGVQQEGDLPSKGRHFLSQFDDVSIIVYQTVADNKQNVSDKRCDVSEVAEEHSKTVDKDLNANHDTPCLPSNDKTDPDMTTTCETDEHVYAEVGAIDSGKVTDIDPQTEDCMLLHTSFVQTMISCEWGKKSGHEKVLAISVKREGFEELLRTYVDDKKNNQKTGDVKVEWNPDKSPTGGLLKRYVPEIVIRGRLLQKFNKCWTLNVKDMSVYVEHLRRFMETGKSSRIWTPKESVYISESSEVCSRMVVENIDLTGIEAVSGTLAEAYSHIDTCLEPSLPKEAILYLYGSFNPIHMGHVNAIVESKRWLDTMGHYNVIATKIGITSDSALKEKCSKPGDLCIKFEHRRKLCELACSDYPWIEIYPNKVSTQMTFGQQIRRELNKPDATLVVLVGSDRAILEKRRVKSIRRDNKFVVCIGRIGMSPTEKKSFQEAEQNDPKRSHEFFVVPSELNDLSSTSIRQKLSQTVKGSNSKKSKKSKKDLRIINGMIAAGWIAEEEGTYMYQHINDMFY
ncbi:uncharacterized protein LOC123559349 [Mercenaria mercenaria]|uniref:uncharacterized protein LOC123559349 n=1 Tax=Mercenaria mercenaria TaxID=6596 RepID=UPI00234F08B6|nr:uncharacterized protein LOC123559349 [Mercenaria mercenaria]